MLKLILPVVVVVVVLSGCLPAVVKVDETLLYTKTVMACDGTDTVEVGRYKVVRTYKDGTVNTDQEYRVMSFFNRCAL